MIYKTFNGNPEIKVFKTPKKGSLFSSVELFKGIEIKVFENDKDITNKKNIKVDIIIHLRDFISFEEFKYIFKRRLDQAFVKTSGRNFNCLEKEAPDILSNKNKSWGYGKYFEKLEKVWNYSEPNFSSWWIDVMVEQAACNVYNVVWNEIRDKLKDNPKRDKVAYKEADKAYLEVKHIFR